MITWIFLASFQLLLSPMPILKPLDFDLDDLFGLLDVHLNDVLVGMLRSLSQNRIFGFLGFDRSTMKDFVPPLDITN